MADSNKTKAEILQELESIKGLLMEEDHIPILQAVDEQFYDEIDQRLAKVNPSVLPGQTSLFDDLKPYQEHTINQPKTNPPSQPETSKSNNNHKTSAQPSGFRTLAKASGENPFLPQHIRERLHGNKPPPVFEYETAKKILNATKHIAHKINKPRQTLVDDLLNSLMPQIERELRHRLFAMSVEDLEKLLNEEEDDRPH